MEGKRTETDRLRDGFSGYNAADAIRDDQAVRRKLVDELESARGHLSNIHEDAYNEGDGEIRSAVRRVIDEVELFQTEVRATEVSGGSLFGGVAECDNPDLAKRLVEFDLEALGGAQQAVVAVQLLEREYGGLTTESVKKSLRDLRSHLTGSRNAFKGRRDFIRGIR